MVEDINTFFIKSAEDAAKRRILPLYIIMQNPESDSSLHRPKGLSILFVPGDAFLWFQQIVPDNRWGTLRDRVRGHVPGYRLGQG